MKKAFKVVSVISIIWGIILGVFSILSLFVTETGEELFVTISVFFIYALGSGLLIAFGISGVRYDEKKLKRGIMLSTVYIALYSVITVISVSPIFIIIFAIFLPVIYLVLAFKIKHAGFTWENGMMSDDSIKNVETVNENNGVATNREMTERKVNDKIVTESINVEEVDSLEKLQPQKTTNNELQVKKEDNIKICSKCGNKENSNFCSKCGTKMTAIKEKNKESYFDKLIEIVKEHKNMMPVAIILIVIIGVGIYSAASDTTEEDYSKIYALAEEDFEKNKSEEFLNELRDETGLDDLNYEYSLGSGYDDEEDAIYMHCEIKKFTSDAIDEYYTETLNDENASILYDKITSLAELGIDGYTFEDTIDGIDIYIGFSGLGQGTGLARATVETSQGRIYELKNDCIYIDNKLIYQEEEEGDSVSSTTETTTPTTESEDNDGYSRALTKEYKLQIFGYIATKENEYGAGYTEEIADKVWKDAASIYGVTESDIMMILSDPELMEEYYR